MAESIRRRYLSKIGGNLGSGALTLLSQSLLGRLLGPASYGQFIFVQAHFESLFTDLGITTSLFTRISQDKRTYPGVSAFFIVLVGTILSCVLAYVGVVFLSGKSGSFWPEIQASTVWLGGALAFATYLARNGILLADAAGYASKIELSRCYRSVLTVTTIALLGYFGKLTLATGLITLALWQLSFLVQVLRYGHEKMGGVSPDFSARTLKSLVKELRGIAGPLVAYSVFNIFINLIDRWMLQRLSGSTEQSFFGVAFQISTALFLATCALTSIFQREAAVAFASKNWEQLNFLFRVYLRRIFAVAAVPCIFVAANASTIAIVFGGERFRPAAPAIALMALQPIIQGAGQLSVAFQYAMNRTRLYAVTSILRDIVGIPISILLLGNELFGVKLLHLGAEGLAIKSLFVISTTTYVFHYVNCKTLNLSFLNHLGKELGLVLPLGIGALLARYAANVMVSGISIARPDLLAFVFAGVLYLGWVMSMLMLAPRLYGFENLAAFRSLSLRRA